MSSFTLRVPDDLLAKVREGAKQRNISMNSWVLNAIRSQASREERYVVAAAKRRERVASIKRQEETGEIGKWTEEKERAMVERHRQELEAWRIRHWGTDRSKWAPEDWVIFWPPTDNDVERANAALAAEGRPAFAWL